MLSFRTGVRDGKLSFSYAIPDTTDYRLSVHAVPTGESAATAAPFTSDYVFSVPEVQPGLQSQVLAMITLLTTAFLGFVLGFKREAARARADAGAA